MEPRWRTSNKAVYNIGYHLIWCPKYRRPVLEGEIDSRLRELLMQRASDLGISIEQMEIMPDHLHLFIKSSPVHAPHFIVQQLKGHTSRILRREFKTLRTRIPTLWTRSYYCESVGHISEDTVRRYIEEQKSY
ncbi:MAG: IS200/IS605 family transposase [Syntrophorhabdaceae bacterium]|nr:IS200/IS605 family transposase [Syntrophorhabdaceae bacterium]